MVNEKTIPQVFFYYDAPDRLAAAATLVMGAYAQGKFVHVLVPQPDELARLDRILWTMRSQSFVPHCSVDSPLAATTPILLSQASQTLPDNDRLMNLGADIPPDHPRFPLLIEVVGCEESERQAARLRVQHYREKGIQVSFFNLGTP